MADHCHCAIMQNVALLIQTRVTEFWGTPSQRLPHNGGAAAPLDRSLTRMTTGCGPGDVGRRQLLSRSSQQRPYRRILVNDEGTLFRYVDERLSDPGTEQYVGLWFRRPFQSTELGRVCMPA